MFLFNHRFSYFDLIWVLAMHSLWLDGKITIGLIVGADGALASVILEKVFTKRKIP